MYYTIKRSKKITNIDDFYENVSSRNSLNERCMTETRIGAHADSSEKNVNIEFRRSNILVYSVSEIQ